MNAKTNNKNDTGKRRFLIPKEVSGILRMSYLTVLDMIKLGVIPAYQLGNRYLVCETELYNFIESKRYKSYWTKKEK